MIPAPSHACYDTLAPCGAAWLRSGTIAAVWTTPAVPVTAILAGDVPDPSLYRRARFGPVLAAILR
jgi:hypothetical protein